MNENALYAAIVVGPIVTFALTFLVLSAGYEQDLQDQEEELRRRFADQVDTIYQAGRRSGVEWAATQDGNAATHRAGFDAGYQLCDRLDRIDAEARCRECAAGVR